MRLLRTAVVAAAVLTAAPALAQFSNHGIAVESGLSAPLGGGGGVGASFAVTASTWLEGDLEAFARVARSSAGEPGVRGAVPVTAGTLGLRLSLGRAPLRPAAFLEAGWARAASGGTPSDRAAFGAGAALEWFPAGDFSLSPRLALRAAGAALSLELTFSLGGYF